MKKIFGRKKKAENGDRAEKCVLCHADTGYTFNTPVEERDGYVEGVGQLCWKCWIEFSDGDHSLKETTTVIFAGKRDR